ncbi:MAG: hypothetical protein GF308_10355 [Candidatus Heimdallarchaeota archaeon]|nr:hypothetical protein [Candidatus Heimdallarchaeota archaeon]
MSVPFEGYLVVGKDGNSFDDIVYNGLLRAKRYLWMTGAKTTDFVIPNRKTKEAFNFSDRLVQLRNRGVKIKLLLTPRERTRSLFEKLKNEHNIDFRFCYDIHMKIFLVNYANTHVN